MLNEIYYNLLKTIPLPCIVGEKEGNDIKIKYINNKFNENINIDKYKNINFTSLLNSYDKDEFINALNNCTNKHEDNCFLFIPFAKYYYNVNIKELSNSNFMLTFYDYLKNEKYVVAPVFEIEKTILYIEDKHYRLVYCNNIAKQFYFDVLNKKVDIDNFIGEEVVNIIENKGVDITFENNDSILSGQKKTILNSKVIGDNTLINYKFPLLINNNIEGTVILETNIDDTSTISSLRITKELMMQQLSDTLLYGIFFINIEEEIMYCNQSVCDIFSVNKDILIGINCNNSRDAIINILAANNNEVLESEKTITYTKIMDNEKCIQITKIPFYDDYSNLAGICGIMSDITTINKMKKETEEISMQFYSNLTHEFMTPMNMIFSFIQIMQGNLEKEKDNTNYRNLVNYFGIIKNNTFDLFCTIKNIIFATEINTKVIKYTPQNSDIVYFSEQKFNSIIKYINNQNNVDILFDTNKEEQIICFDPAMAEMILINVIFHGLKYLVNNKTVLINLIIDKKWVSLTFNNVYCKDAKKYYEMVKNKMDECIKSEKSFECNNISMFVTIKLLLFHNGKIDIDLIDDTHISASFCIPNQKLEEEH